MKKLSFKIEHPVYIIVAVLLAVFAWLYVQSSEVMEERINADISWQHPPSLVTTESLPDRLTIAVQGPLWATRAAEREDITLDIDLSRMSVGTHTVDFSAEQLVGLPNGVTVLSVIPPDLELTLDEVTKRKMKVVPITVGDVQPGYTMESVLVTPSVVELSGAKLVIGNQMEISTKPIDVSGIGEFKELAADLDLAWGVAYKGDPLVARIDVSASIESTTINDVPVSVLDPKGGWKVGQQSIEVMLEGPAASLRKIKKDDLQVVVHLPTEVTRGRLQATLAGSAARLQVINLPEDVRVVATTPAVLDVTKR